MSTCSGWNLTGFMSCVSYRPVGLANDTGQAGERPLDEGGGLLVVVGGKKGG